VKIGSCNLTERRGDNRVPGEAVLLLLLLLGLHAF
jgi:hypothetical protein